VLNAGESREGERVGRGVILRLAIFLLLFSFLSTPRISTPESHDNLLLSYLCSRPISPGDLSKADLEGKTVLVSVFSTVCEAALGFARGRGT